MKLYMFSPDDLPHPNWLFHTVDRDRNVPDPPYDKLVCVRCGRFSYDDVFALGFEKVSPFFRVKTDIFCSDEGFYCVNKRFTDLIQMEQFPGLNIKPAGNTGWNVINITARFEVRDDVYQKARPELCRVCGRPTLIGSLRHLGQMRSFPKSETFFSTTTDRQGSGGLDRDFLLTEGIVTALKRNKIKGGALHELLDEETDAKLSIAWQRGEKIKFPKGSQIVL